jgi:GTP-binding protein
MVEIVDAKFITSAPSIDKAPPSELQNEIVFMARSNAGKSSLLNALANHKGLAKVSATPGKTRLINYFDITFLNRDTNEKSIASLVDLPGFGYAKVSKSMKYDWERNLTDYIAQREQIKVFVHLIDSRHPDLEIDTSVSQFLDEIVDASQIILKVFTKIDKLNQKEQNELRNKFPGALMVSSSKKRGISKMVSLLYDILHETSIDDNL